MAIDLNFDDIEEQPIQKADKPDALKVMANAATVEPAMVLSILANPKIGFKEKASIASDYGDIIEGRLKSGVEGLRRFTENVFQLINLGEEKIGTAEPGSTAALREDFQAGRKQREEAFKAEHGENPSFDLTRELTQGLAPFAVPPIRAVGSLGAGSKLLSEAPKLQKLAQAGSNIVTGVTTGAVIGGVSEAGSEKERIKKVKSGMAWGAGGAATVEAAKTIAPFISMTKEPFKKSLKSIFGKEGIKLSEEVGPLKPSQISGNVWLKEMEKMSSQTAKGAEMERLLHNKQVLSSAKFFKRAGMKLSKFKPGKEGARFGERIEKAFNNTLDNALKFRASRAEKLFSIAAKETKGKKVVPTETVRKTINRLLDEIKGPGKENKPLENSLKSILKDISPAKTKISVSEKIAPKGKIRLTETSKTGGEFENLTVMEAQRKLADWGGSAYGKGTLFSKLDKSSQTRYARELYEALKADISGVSQLKNARAIYKLDSKAIDDLRNTALSSLFNTTKAPDFEKIAESFKTMNTAQIKTTMGILQRTDPGIHSAFQRAWIDRAWKLAKDSSKPATEFPFNVGKFANNLIPPGKNEKFEAIFNDSKSRKMIRDGINYIRRIDPKSIERAQSILSTGKETAGVVGGLATGQGSPVFMARIASVTQLHRMFRHALLDEQGIKALRTLATEETSATKAAEALSKIAAIAGTSGRDEEDIQPIQELDFTDLETE